MADDDDTLQGDLACRVRAGSGMVPEPTEQLSWQTEVLYVADMLACGAMTRLQAWERLRALAHEREGE